MTRMWRHILKFFGIWFTLLIGASTALADASADCEKLSGDAAIAACDKAISQNPRDAVSYNKRGFEYKNKGDLDRAMVDYNKAVELNPKYAVAYNNRGNVYFYKKEHDRAIADYTKAVEFNPKYATAYHNRGFVYHYKKEYDRAIADHTKAIAINPRYSNAYDSRGNAYEAKGDHERAIADHNEAIEIRIADYTKAIELDPSWGSYTYRGMAYLTKKDYERAAADHTKAIELNPEHAFPWLNRCEIYAIQGKLELALRDCDRSLSLWTVPEALRIRGIVNTKLSRFDLAIKDFDAALKAVPKRAKTLYARGVAKIKSGNTSGGRVDIDAAIKIDGKAAEQFRMYGINL